MWPTEHRVRLVENESQMNEHDHGEQRAPVTKLNRLQETTKTHTTHAAIATIGFGSSSSCCFLAIVEVKIVALFAATHFEYLLELKSAAARYL